MLLLDNISSQYIELNTMDPWFNKIQLSDSSFCFPYLYVVCGGSRQCRFITFADPTSHTHLLHICTGVFFPLILFFWIVVFTDFFFFKLLCFSEHLFAVDLLSYTWTIKYKFSTCKVAMQMKWQYIGYDKMYTL